MAVAQVSVAPATAVVTGVMELYTPAAEVAFSIILVAVTVASASLKNTLVMSAPPVMADASQRCGDKLPVALILVPVFVTKASAFSIKPATLLVVLNKVVSIHLLFQLEIK